MRTRATTLFSLAELAPRAVIDDKAFGQHFVKGMIKKEATNIRLHSQYYDAGFKKQPLDPERCVNVSEMSANSSTRFGAS